MPSLRVLVVDDSAIIRDILKAKLSSWEGIEVVATAPDPYVARHKLEQIEVDVVTLDLDLPRMDGLTFLKHLMRDHPLPVIVVSSLGRQREVALSCLDAGAVDLVAKPTGGTSVDQMVAELADKILSCRQVRRPVPRPSVLPPLQRTTQGERIAVDRHLVVVGASTGGTQALETLFQGFPVTFPPVLAVIHMPPGFTKTFAQRLNARVPMKVKEAEDGEILLPGTIYIAPGNRHLKVGGPGGHRSAQLTEEPKVHNQRPAVDTLFESAAVRMGSSTVGILLTGMGKDGALGLKKIREAGGRTAAQDEQTCVVYGMPKEAVALEAAQQVLALPKIAPWAVETLVGGLP